MNRKRHNPAAGRADRRHARDVSAASFAQTTIRRADDAADKKAAKKQDEADKNAAVAQAKADKKKTEAQSDANEAAADAKLKNAKKAE